MKTNQQPRKIRNIDQFNRKIDRQMSILLADVNSIKPLSRINNFTGI